MLELASEVAIPHLSPKDILYLYLFWFAFFKRQGLIVVQAGLELAR